MSYKIMKPKKSKPQKPKKKQITKAKARELAGKHVLRRLFKGRTVEDGAKVLLGMFILDKWRPKDTWVVYQNWDGPPMIRDSRVILVCKRTGRILYEGGACDVG